MGTHKERDEQSKAMELNSPDLTLESKSEGEVAVVNRSRKKRSKRSKITSKRTKKRLQGPQPDIFGSLIENIGGKVIRFSQTMVNTLARYARSDKLTGTDRFYATLIKETYPECHARKESISTDLDGPAGKWVCQTDLDSSYISVWDQEGSNKRFVAVRGTKTENDEDIYADIRIAFFGTCGNRIVEDLIKIIEDSKEHGKTVEIGGHSLGCTLIFAAYDNHPELLSTESPIAKTYQYNPPYCPRWLLRGITSDTCLSKKFEKQENIRWFINLYDLVSIGGSYDQGPTEAVYFNAADARVSGWELTIDSGIEICKKASTILDGIANGKNEQISESAKKFMSVHKLSQWIDGRQ